MTDVPTPEERTPLEQAIAVRGNPGTVVGGIIALISFFLPYASSPSFLGLQISRSGAQIGGALWLVFLSALTIIAVYALMPGERYRKDRLTLILTAAAAGILILLIGAVKLYSKKNVLGVQVSASDFGIHLNIGAIGSFLGLVLTFAIALSERTKTSAFNAVQQAVAPALSETSRSIEALAERTKAAAQLGRQTAPKVGDWFSAQSELVAGWVSNHVKPIAMVAGILLLLTGAYAVFRPSPTRDAARIANAYRTCDDQSKRDLEQQQQALVAEFRSKPAATRRAAYDRVEQVTAPIRGSYSKCVDAADSEYERASRRYAGTSQRGSRFFSEFQKYIPGARPTAQSFSTATQYEGQLQAEIAKVTPPWPSNDRIIQDLLGKQVDGWRFAYPSEFLVITRDDSFQAAQQPNASTVRMHMQLDDYNTHEKYFAIVDLTYDILPAADDWTFNNVREIYLTKGDTLKYREGGQFFLLGKWRWDGNDAVYAPDGTWTGRWDDGTSHGGEWRIVHDNLVLTRDGNLWLSVPIVEHDTRVFAVDNNGRRSRAERVE